MTIEQRHDRDLVPVLDARDTADQTDALEPLFDAVQRLEASLDRAVKQAEDARAKSEERRRAKRDSALVRLVDEAFRKLERPSVQGFHIEPSNEGF